MLAHKSQVPTQQSLLYHSVDRLENFQFRISLRRLGGGISKGQQELSARVILVQRKAFLNHPLWPSKAFIHWLQWAADQDSGDEESDFGGHETSAECISLLFSWQEKVYSFAESTAGKVPPPPPPLLLHPDASPFQ